jgi:hypothetical protein
VRDDSRHRRASFERVFKIFQTLGASPGLDGALPAIVKRIVENHGARIWGIGRRSGRLPFSVPKATEPAASRV